MSDDTAEGGAIDEPAETPAWAAPTGERPGMEWTPEWLIELRESDSRRYAALVAAALVGLGLAMVHWLGLFLAGAIVGLIERSVRRAVTKGLAVGVIVLLVHVAGSPVMSPDEFVGLGPPAFLSLAGAIVAPVWGSLARAVL